MRKKFAMLLAAGLAAGVARGVIDVKMTYSTDGGKSWSRDYPTVEPGGKVQVRADYTIVDVTDKRDALAASIKCPEKFASHTHSRKREYVQRHKVYWRSPKVNDKYVWDVDTGGLEEGSHMFMVDIGYRTMDDKPVRHTDCKIFYIMVDGKCGVEGAVNGNNSKKEEK